MKDYIFLLDYCGVPKRQINEVVQLMDAIDLLNFRKGDSVYLSGPAGSGKTLIAIKLILFSLSEDKHVKYILHKLDALNDEYDISYASGLSHLFIRVPDLLSNIRETFNRKFNQDYDGVQETERSIIKKYSEVDFLVLDDFGAEKITDWSFSVLYLIIDNRYNNYKRTIITSNYPLNQLAEKLGDDRIPSRIRAMCSLVKISGEDKRK